MNAHKQKKILVLHTGGTFGMETIVKKNEPSVKVLKNSHSQYLQNLFTHVPEVKFLATLELRVLFNLDSSDMGPENWKTMAQVISDTWDNYDGFVIIHGTDTMAYSAAALSFLLRALTKPIVFTGSQRPLAELRSDARANLIDAVELATSGIPEVMVCFHSKVHRGTRVTKHSNEHMQAFRSVNSPVLGHFGVHFKLNKRIALSPIQEFLRHKPTLDLRISNEICVIDAIPGAIFAPSIRSAIVKSCKGIVLKGFGSGNLPLKETSMIELCQAAALARIPVIMATQCGAGSVSLNEYENGRVFAQAGLIPALDMSLESVAVKLMILVGRGVCYEDAKQFFATPLAFECVS